MQPLVIDVFVALFAAHVLGDFVLQTNRDVALKRHASFMSRHVLIHAALSYALAGIWTAVWIPVVVAATHYAIDWYKLRFGDTTLRWFLGDQAAHLLVLLLLAVVAASMHDATAWHHLAPDFIYTSLALVAGFIVTVRVGSMTTALVLAPYLADMESRQDAERLPWNRGFADGGRVIGYLERTLLFVFILAGHVAAVGFLVAAKAFFRIGEITNRENRLEAEYIIIGTLMSFSHGVIAAYGTSLLLMLR